MLVSRLVVRIAAAGTCLAAACGGSVTPGDGSSSADAGAVVDGSRGPGAAPDAARDSAPGLGSSGGSSGASSSGSHAGDCAPLETQYHALGTTTAYVSCAGGSDCAIVSDDLCFAIPNLALNAAGVTEAHALKAKWTALDGCGTQDCGSSSGASATPACQGSVCVALGPDGGVVH